MTVSRRRAEASGGGGREQGSEAISIGPRDVPAPPESPDRGHNAVRGAPNRPAKEPTMAEAKTRMTVTRDERDLLARLRRTKPGRIQPEAMAPTSGQRLADRVAGAVGSWRFIALQSALLALWLIGNAWIGAGAWDPYPFILLNLLLSFQAAYTAPVILMSQNRQADIDRDVQRHDYEINAKAELEIELLHEKIDLMREQEMARLIGVIEKIEARLAAARHSAPPPPARA